MQALFVLAFVLALRETTRNPDWRDLPLRFVPAALIAVGAVYTYSFPGLIWLAASARSLSCGTALGRAERGALARCRPLLLGRSARASRSVVPARARPDDRLPQLRDLRPQRPRPRQPLRPDLAASTALGIWSSGDFRVAAGDGAVPAIGYYLGAAFAAVLLVSACCAAGAVARARSSPALGAVALLYARGPDRRHPVHLGQGARDRGAASSPSRSSPPGSARAAEGRSGLADLGLPARPRASARCWRSPTPRSGRPPTRRR